jgi:hypothetical protein
MLDKIDHSILSGRGQNSYALGTDGMHETVLAVMPEIGNSQAALVAAQLLNNFPSIMFGLLVGIGGGIPGKDEDDILLGDVVSKLIATFGGVVQDDTEKSGPVLWANRNIEETSGAERRMFSGSRHDKSEAAV